jgi:hypothetical protein
VRVEQDLKTGDLLRVSPRAQCIAQSLGSLASAGLVVAAFAVYTHAYAIPSKHLPAPTAQVRCLLVCVLVCVWVGLSPALWVHWGEGMVLVIRGGWGMWVWVTTASPVARTVLLGRGAFRGWRDGMGIRSVGMGAWVMPLCSGHIWARQSSFSCRGEASTFAHTSEHLSMSLDVPHPFPTAPYPQSPPLHLPTSPEQIWLSMARVVNGNGLPPHVLPLCLALGGLFMLLALLSAVHPPARRWCPSGIGVAVGMYVSPCALFGCAVCTVLYELFPLTCASHIISFTGAQGIPKHKSFTGAQGIPKHKSAHSSSLAARACTICLAWASFWWLVTVSGQQVRMRGNLLCHCFLFECARGWHLGASIPPLQVRTTSLYPGTMPGLCGHAGVAGPVAHWPG